MHLSHIFLLSTPMTLLGSVSERNPILDEVRQMRDDTLDGIILVDTNLTPFATLPRHSTLSAKRKKAMKLPISIVFLALSAAPSSWAFVHQPSTFSLPASSPSTTMLAVSSGHADSSSAHDNNSGTRKIGQAALAATLLFGSVFPHMPAQAIDYRLPPIDRSDPARCTLKSSTIGQSNAQRDKLFDLRECQLRDAKAPGYDLSGVIM